MDELTLVKVKVSLLFFFAKGSNLNVFISRADVGNKQRQNTCSPYWLQNTVTFNRRNKIFMIHHLLILLSTGLCKLGKKNCRITKQKTVFF